MESIAELLADMQAGRPIARSPELNELAKAVVANNSKRDAEDIDAWAEALGQRIAEYTGDD